MHGIYTIVKFSFYSHCNYSRLFSVGKFTQFSVRNTGGLSSLSEKQYYIQATLEDGRS